MGTQIHRLQGHLTSPLTKIRGNTQTERQKARCSHKAYLYFFQNKGHRLKNYEIRQYQVKLSLA
jgi:hypothetical protein